MLQIKVFFRTIFKTQVFTPMLGAIGCAAGVLRLTGTQIVPGLSNKALIWVVAIVGLYAGIVAISEARRVYKRLMAKALLVPLTIEGRTFIADLSKSLDEEGSNKAKDWIQRVESCIGKYLDDSFLTRFRLILPFTMKDNFVALGDIQQKVDKLEEFLRDLAN